MEVITIQSEAFQELVKKMDEIQTKLTAKEKEPKEIWLDNQEFIQLLKISKRTAQHYRDTGMISFSQVGSKNLLSYERCRGTIEKALQQSI